MTYEYDLEDIKEKLTIDQIVDIVAELGGEPVTQNDAVVSKTICHCGQSHKLYYWDNTHLFKCFTDCGETFDIFELVRKVKTQSLGIEYQLPQAVEYVASYFGFSKNIFEEEQAVSIQNYLTSLQNYDRIKNVELKTQTVELKTYDGSFLKNMPQPIILPWIEDGITKETMDYYDIHYDPRNGAVVIPHVDINGNLIGIRERTLSAENAEKYGKYLPLKIGRQMYNHPLSFSLYGLYQNKDNIRKIKKAIVLEGEKSVLQLDNILGRDNNIGVAICGSSFINYQFWLLVSLGVEEIIIGLDKQYQELNDKEHEKLVRNLKNIHKKYGKYVKITYLFDKGSLLPYKASPTDKGKDVFMELFRKRVSLY